MNSRYDKLLAQYRETLTIEERTLAAIMLSHGGHSAKFKKQRNRVETFRRQVAELERLANEVTK